MPDVNINTDLPPDSIFTRRIEQKFYELTDHLGNVRATLSDRKLTGTPGSGPYHADIRSYNHPYPFGMPQPGRSWDSVLYRYGFNGMETDPEVKEGRDQHYTTFFRQYDPRLGRWWSHDPVKQLGESPYAAMFNNPVMFSDPLGDCLGCGDANDYDPGTFIEDGSGRNWQVQRYVDGSGNTWVGEDAYGTYRDHPSRRSYSVGAALSGASGAAAPERTFWKGAREAFVDIVDPIGNMVVNLYDNNKRGPYLEQLWDDAKETAGTFASGLWTGLKAEIGDRTSLYYRGPSIFPALKEAQQERNGYLLRVGERISNMDEQDAGYVTVMGIFIIVDVALGSHGKGGLDAVDALEDAGSDIARKSDNVEGGSGAGVANVALSPQQINFSQRTVSGNVNQYIDDMKAGTWDWDKSGPIRIMKIDDKWVSYDNRRLLAAQKAGLPSIPYQVVKAEDIMPGSKKTWTQAFEKRFKDGRNVEAGGVVPNGGLSSQPKVVE